MDPYTKEHKETLVRDMIRAIGDVPERDGVKDTPARVVRSWKEMFRGYNIENRPKITTFDNGKDGITYDQMVIDTGNFYSHCEHHMIPFFGQYWFGYIPHPKGKVLGLSKVARIVDFYSAKLQIQERLVNEIVNCLWMATMSDKYAPIGMGLVMKATHLCKCMRGARKDGNMTSIYLTGALRDNHETRAEFMKFVNGGK